MLPLLVVLASALLILQALAWADSRRQTSRLKVTLMNGLDQLAADLDAETNAIAARLDKLSAELAAAGQAPTPEQLAKLQAISDRLKSLGADPATPIPAP